MRCSEKNQQVRTRFVGLSCRSYLNVINKERDEVFPEVTPMSVYERKDFRVKSAFDVRRPRSFPSHQAGHDVDGVRGLVESRRKSLNECE